VFWVLLLYFIKDEEGAADSLLFTLCFILLAKE
jgi:hypothetical protein